MKFSLVLIVTLINFVISEGCKCNQLSFKQSFCSSRFFGLITIITKAEDDVNNGQLVKHNYGVRVNHNFHNSQQFIRTIKTNANCGPKLHLGHDYLISGSPDFGVLQLTNCNYFVNWSQLSNDQKIYKTSSFKNIDCEEFTNYPSP